MIADVLPRYQATADGSTTEYTTPFSLLNASFVNVYIASTKQTSGYTVNVATNKITFSTAPESGKVITIIRALPINWEVSSFGSINEESLDTAFSYIVAKLQTIEEEVSRSPKTNPYDSVTGEDLSATFIQEMRDALDSLAQAQIVYAQVQASGAQALTDISTEKATAISNINSTASDRTGEFNANATAKTTAFNNNANDETDAFNANATAKTTAFNTNATNKTGDFDNNATAKTTAFDTNAATKQAAVDASATAAATSATHAANSATAAATSATNAAATETRINNTLSTYVRYIDWPTGTV